MPKRYHHLIENQSKVKVIAQAHDTSKDTVRFVTLAAVAGVFYFFSYYFGGDLWRVLAGG